MISHLRNETRPTDYSQESNWLYLPDTADQSVDIFYLYPTAWTRRPGEDFICPVDHQGMRKGAETVFWVQASVFFPVGNVFAPFYRQLDGAFMLEKSFGERRGYLSDIPGKDVRAAFQYYISHYNQGRPFILAAHSQGSDLLKELLFKDMGDNDRVYKRMIAAYVIGTGITRKELEQNPHLTFAQRADDTNVIVSYNTEAPGIMEPNPTVQPDSLVINPLSWTTTDTLAPESMNRGSLITGKGTLSIEHCFADAKIDTQRGTLICSTVSPLEYGSPPPLGTFHSLDIGLYYCNLRENALLRIRNYLYE